MEKKTGIELIVQERQEQIEKHGRTIEYDFKANNHYQLSQAAGLLSHLDPEEFGDNMEACCPIGWDINLWTKMMSKPYKERLVIAGALCAAEIDRLNISED